MDELDTKQMLAVASIAAGLGCIAAGIVQQNGSVLAVGAGLLGAPGVLKGTGSESVPEPPASPTPPLDPEGEGDMALVEDDVAAAPMSADASYGGSGELGADVTDEFADDIVFEDES